MKVIRPNIVLLGAFLCFASLAVAYFYFERFLGLPPCPLCILDRIFIGALGVIFLLLYFGYNLILRVLGLIIIIGGALVAARHNWQERFASNDAAACIPQQAGLDNLIEWLTAAFIGTSDCGVIYWSLNLLGTRLSIADMVSILYLVLIFLWFVAPKKQPSLFK